MFSDSGFARSRSGVQCPQGFGVRLLTEVPAQWNAGPVAVFTRH